MAWNVGGWLHGETVGQTALENRIDDNFNECTPARITSVGDQVRGDGANSIERVAIEASGKVWASDGTKPVWSDKKWAVTFQVGNGVEEISAGTVLAEYKVVRVPYNSTITDFELVSDASGDLVLGVWAVSAYSDVSTAGTADSIAGTQKPTLLGSQTDTNYVLGDWDKTLSEDNYILVRPESAGTVKAAWLTIKGKAR